MVAVTDAQQQYLALAEILRDLNSQGEFLISVLTDENGLPMAASGDNSDESETQSAVVAQVQGVVLKVLNHLSMAEPEEFAMNDINGKRLICRSFPLGDNPAILAVLTPNKTKAYRKLMNKAIRAIQTHAEF